MKNINFKKIYGKNNISNLYISIKIIFKNNI